MQHCLQAQETLPQKLCFSAEKTRPAVATLGRRHFGRAGPLAAKPMGSPRVGSNPIGVVRVQSGFVWKANTLQIWGRDDLDVFFFKNNRLNLLKKKASKSSRPLIFYPGLVRRHGTKEAKGLFWELSPGPLTPEARIMPLDQTASGAHASSGTYN